MRSTAEAIAFLNLTKVIKITLYIHLTPEREGKKFFKMIKLFLLFLTVIILVEECTVSVEGQVLGRRDEAVHEGLDCLQHSVLDVLAADLEVRDED